MMRVIALIDMDCFYAQVEQRECPSLWDKPVAVVQHSREGSPGGILAVSYEARAFGVKRGMMIPEALKVCPSLNIRYVPKGEHIDKADIQKYRDASAEVFAVLDDLDERVIVEKASVDEAFLDVTKLVEDTLYLGGESERIVRKLVIHAPFLFPSSHVANGKDRNDENKPNFHYDRLENMKEWFNKKCKQDRDLVRLAVATDLIERIRHQIHKKTGFYCSAGIGNSKMIAKLVCARHKPRQQTVIPPDCIRTIFKHTPISDVRMLGGKLGDTLKQQFKINTMFELSQVDLELLKDAFPHPQARWIWKLGRGIDEEPVKSRDTQSSIAVSKNFPGRSAIVTVSEMRRWIDGLAKELSKRLYQDKTQNKRVAQNLIFGVVTSVNHSRTLKINSYSSDVLFDIIWAACKPLNKGKDGTNVWDPAVYNINLSAARFTAGASAESNTITNWVNSGVRRGLGGEGFKNLVVPKEPTPAESQSGTSETQAEKALTTLKSEASVNSLAEDKLISKGENVTVEVDAGDKSVELTNREMTAEIKSTLSQLSDQADKTREVKTESSAVEEPPMADEGWTASQRPKESDVGFEEILQLGEVKVAKSVYDELPEFIKEELKNEPPSCSTSSRPPKTEVVFKVPGKMDRPKRKRAPPKRKEPPPKKKIDAYFTKS